VILKFPPDDWISVTPEAERIARRWSDSIDPAVGVGAKHHTVPAFYLRRFADKDKHLLVRERPTGTLSTRTVSKLAVTDFYTAITKDGQLDAAIEQILSVVENNAAEVLQLLLSPFRRPGPLAAEDHLALCQFLAFQMVRGPRKRREIELEADYAVKMQAGDALTERDLREITAVPHPNAHIQLMGPLAYSIFQWLQHRPVQIVWLDAPLLVTCDEPVLVDNEDHVKHLPECSLTRTGPRQRRSNASAGGSAKHQIIHVWLTRPSGVQVADAVAMPLTPKALLVLGRIGDRPDPEVFFDGGDARALADEVNAALVDQAYEWVAAHPGHRTFRDWELPPPGPLIGVCDGGTVMSQQLKAAPPHRWARLRKDWPGMPSQ
jgi:hypothetical protein